MNSYRNAEIEYRERCKARIQRQLEISENLLFLFLLSRSSSYCVVGNAFNVVYYSFLFLSWLRFKKIFVMCSFVTMKFRWFIEINAKRESTGSLRSVRRFTCCCCSLWILFDLLDIRKAKPMEFYCECF